MSAHADRPDRAPVVVHDDWLRVAEAAGLLGVSLNTLRRWTDAGRLACYRSPGGHRRYRAADIQALLQQAGRSRRLSRPPCRPVQRRAPSYGARHAEALSTIAAAAVGTLHVAACVVATSQARTPRLSSRPRTENDGARSPFHPGSVVPIKAMPLASAALQSRRTVTDRRPPGHGGDDSGRRRLLPAHSRHPQCARQSTHVQRGQDPVGVFMLFEDRTPRHFTDADIALAEHFAAQAAVLAAPPDGAAGPPARAAHHLE